jgi:hypothetical protein
VRQEKAAPPLLEGLLVADFLEISLRVRAAQEELPVPLDIRDGDAAGGEPLDGLQEPRDGRGLELGVGDEEMEDVPRRNLVVPRRAASSRASGRPSSSGRRPM